MSDKLKNQHFLKKVTVVEITWLLMCLLLFIIIFKVKTKCKMLIYIKKYFFNCLNLDMLNTLVMHCDHLRKNEISTIADYALFLSFSYH